MTPPTPPPGSDTPPRGRVMIDVDQSETQATASSSAFTRAPSYSPEERAGFRDFAKVMRDAMGEKGSFDELSPEDAAEHGCLGTLHSLHRPGRVTFNEDLCKAAASGGQCKVLKWLRENGYPWNADACTSAAYNGHLGVLKWLRTNGCPWDADTCSYAAEGRHLDMLQWLRAKSCPWDELT